MRARLIKIKRPDGTTVGSIWGGQNLRAIDMAAVRGLGWYISVVHALDVAYLRAGGVIHWMPEGLFERRVRHAG